MKEFENYIILITGGGTGIGRETAEQFVREGAEVVITGRNQDTLDEAVELIGKRMVAKTCDVTNGKEVLELKELVEEQYGKLDILINNAATIRWGTVEDLSEEDWDLTVNSILKGGYLMTKYFIPLLKNSENPSILNVSSQAAYQNWPQNPAYGTAKLGLEKLTRQITRDFFWLRCNSIQPGITETPIYDIWLNEEQKKAEFEKYRKLLPVGRIGKPSDIASVILFLSSKKSSFINGATLLVDGGLCQNWLPGW